MDDKEPCKTTFCKALPLSGEGIVSANIRRRTPFAIRIRPAPCGDDNEISDGEKDKLGYVEVEINREAAVFKYRIPGGGQPVKGTLSSISGINGGLEIDKKVSYWFSFNRNDRILKYGKGYFMEETTILESRFPKTDGDIDPWEFIFRPDQSKEIVIKDVDDIKGLVVLESSRLRERLKMTSSPLGVNEKITANLWSSIPRAERSELAARVDVEKKVSFYPHPLTYNWSPFVLDSSKATLPELANNRYVPSASLPQTCQELYANIASLDVALDWPYSIPRLSDAINYSINTEGKILYEKLKKKQDQGMSEYLRVTLGPKRGSSPGVPYVLEIWPVNSKSGIHNHGNAYGVIKIIHGEIKVTIYNKTWNSEDKQQVLRSFTAKQGDVTWISPNWFQTHKLTNESSNMYCATIQCYKYGCEEELMWPYFDYLDGKTVKEFLPDSDFDYKKLREDLLEEYRRDHCVVKAKM